MLPIFVLLLVVAPEVGAAPRVLRVCADPDNLPFSHRDGGGFENRVAAILADELGAELRYFYWPQRQGFIRNTLGVRACDVVIGVPAGYERVLATRPWYTSSYVFVTRAQGRLQPRSLADPALRRARIGVQLVVDDGSNTPPVHALSRRGLIDNVHGFPVTAGDAILRALAAGAIDVALVWGPLAGAWARGRPDVVVLPLPAADGPDRFRFAIAAGVRRGDRALRDEIDAALARRARDVARVLDAYAVPR